MATKTDTEPAVIMSGHCAYPQTKEPHLSHERCARNGSGSRANPEKRFHPCPCACHLDTEHYTCACGGVIVLASVFGLDEDGDPVYVHIDKHTGRMLYRDCR